MSSGKLPPVWRLGCAGCDGRTFWIYVLQGEVQAICTTCGTWTHDFTPHGADGEPVRDAAARAPRFWTSSKEGPVWAPARDCGEGAP